MILEVGLWSYGVEFLNADIICLVCKSRMSFQPSNLPSGDIAPVGPQRWRDRFSWETEAQQKTGGWFFGAREVMSRQIPFEGLNPGRLTAGTYKTPHFEGKMI